MCVIYCIHPAVGFSRPSKSKFWPHPTILHKACSALPSEWSHTFSLSPPDRITKQIKPKRTTHCARRERKETMNAQSRGGGAPPSHLKNNIRLLLSLSLPSPIFSPNPLIPPRWDCDRLTNLRIPKESRKRPRGPAVAKQQGCPGRPWEFPLAKGAYASPYLILCL